MALDVRRTRGTLGFYVLIATAITTTLLAVLAHYLRESFVFPSVGSSSASPAAICRSSSSKSPVLGLQHAPAGATTLIVALGLVHTLPHIAILFTAVVLVVICAFVINRLAGIPVPWWRPPTP